VLREGDHEGRESLEGCRAEMRAGRKLLESREDGGELAVMIE
jgi:hypothetical protein